MNECQRTWTLPVAVHDLFTRQATRTPDKTAAVDPQGEMTYRELAERATALACLLKRVGAGAPLDRRIGLLADPDPQVLVGMIGILEAGSGFVPIDPRHPDERLAWILEDSACEALVTQRRHLPRAEELARGIPGVRNILCLEDALPSGPLSERPPAAAAGQPRDPRELRSDPGALRALAYIVYTSGSTGRPKGVQVSHENLVPVLLWGCAYLGLGEKTRVLQSLSFCFDFGIFEELTTVLAGGTLWFPGKAAEDPAAFAQEIIRHGINTLHATPAFAHALAATRGTLDSLEIVHLGGEALSRSTVDRIREAAPRATVYNGYGPTEATVNSSIFQIDGRAGGPRDAGSPGVPIGRRSADNALYVLDPGGRPVPSGERGELHVGGIGVARGYLNRPDLTAERFVPDPFGAAPGARLYRTGDLVRVLLSGDLEFLGRIDDQVKIRGFRIELGEVEMALERCAEVRQAVVVALPGPTGDPRLVAYVVPAERAVPDHLRATLPDTLRRQLQALLPEPMVPSVFVLLETLPLSPNGKVDRKALPAPEANRGFAAPRTVTEMALAGIWREILAVEWVGIGDHFLALGGHSLLAAQLIARVRERLGVELSPRDVFDQPLLEDLAAFIAARVGSVAELRPIVPVPRTGDLPLSFAQERVWFLQELDPTIRSYQTQGSLRLRGPLHIEALRRSLSEIVRRHEIFRTTFPTVGERPVQRFHPAWDAPLPMVDLSGLPAGARTAEIAKVTAAACQKLFDMTRLPLIRWTLLRLGPAEHIWLNVEHHLVHDGWSFNRILGELVALYRAFSRGEPSPLPELLLQFADWAAWQRQWVLGPEAAAQIAWWKRTLLGRPPVLALPTDRPRPRRQSFAGRVERVALPAALCSALRSASRSDGVSLFMMMQAAFAALLYRWSGQDQVNVGSGVANRRWSETEPILGMMVDNIVLANDLSGGPTVRELLERTRRLCLEAGANQDIPFDLVVEAVQPERDLAYNPLFQVSFSFHDSPLPELAFPGLQAELTEGISNGSAKFDINVICIPESERRIGRAGGAEAGIRLIWEHSTALFDPSTMRRMIGHFQTLLAGFAAHPESLVMDLPLLTEEERRQLREWSGAEAVFPWGSRSLGVHELFEAAADRWPEALAVTGGVRSLRYGELEALSNRIARRLRALGAGPEARVGVCLERSPELIAATLGVLKAGGAYLPLDPGHPAERLAYILEDSAVPVLITRGALARSLPAGSARVLAIDEERELLERESAARLQPPVLAESLAYVIYTSGSTGQPKGTELTHAGLLNLIGWHHREYGIQPADRATLVASPAFDASVWEIWPALAAGASLHAPPEEVRASPADLLSWLAAERITVCFLPTPLAEACLELELPPKLALRALLTGGDRLHRVERDLPFRLINHYGPTESTVVATAGEVATGPQSETAPPIGRPIANIHAWVLDPSLRRVPAGVPGQLHVGGAGLARGYLRRPELTAERFIPNPFGEEPGTRIYRTGDLVRWLPDGRLDFLGRTDHQVKIRGFRVELGEIETVLGRHPAVRAAVVTAREGADGTRLVAYAVPEGDVAAEELLAFLAGRLPAPMVPSAVVTLDALPLTPNGKVDLAALPEPRPAGEDEGWTGPRTPVEHLLQGIWSELTGVERVGIRDDFFKLGGHSLLGARMLSRLYEELDVEVPLSEVFERRTIEALAVTVEDLLLAEAEALATSVGEAS
ncbi:MAG TPA: amino acid adenylation domain-containing protein [Thermoanaerobaculia bacterium]